MSKAAAGRDKDRAFCMAFLQHGYVKESGALDLVAVMPPDDQGQRRLCATIRRWSKTLRDAGHKLADDRTGESCAPGTRESGNLSAGTNPRRLT
jgi:hypothetical protein